ncbi:MAG: sulfite exporter TauE/SafE family protein [Thermoleophilia bacterium]|nr:sulfite exporter TauE/SafE family protein [Thermoleophilia bacterium]
MSKRAVLFLAFIMILMAVFAAGAVNASTDSGAADQVGEAMGASDSSMPWWVWPLILLAVTFVLGVLAVLGGVGGGVLFVPIVGGFFPFSMDFVRGAGLLVALAGALAAGPGLLKKGLADLRLAIPVALVASTTAVFGAMVGLALPDNIVQATLGAVILGIVLIMALAKKSEYPDVQKADALSNAMRISGVYHEVSSGKDVDWKIHRTLHGLILFIFIGFMAGMFGLGAGWANVPVLNLLMGAPLKVSVASSKFLLSITDTSAAWMYLNAGAVIPMIVVPSIIGIMLGSIVGVKILARTKPSAVRYIVLVMLIFAGVRALLKGTGVWE